jgi:hypothetical protein
MAGHRKVLTSETDQFWECANEAVLLACDAKIAKDKQDLLSFSGSWAQVALLSRSRQLGEVSAALSTEAAVARPSPSAIF